MSEIGMKKIKVFKKNPSAAPIQPAMETVAQNANKSYEEDLDEDDEFERLLNQFINSELEEIDTDIAGKDIPAAISASPVPAPAKPAEVRLSEGERALLEAYKNFINSIIMICSNAELPVPELKFDATLLNNGYKTKIGSIIAEDTAKGWDITLNAHASALAGLHPDAGDEELLDFAEHAEDEILQLAVISYVEILIEMEGCEIALEERRLRAERRKIEREIYEEHQRRIERKQRYIEEIEKKKFPVDAARLVNNYFKTAQKDPEGAYKVLINNPAVYAPINTSKLKPRLFGLIKPTPQDGIRVNRELGNFLKKIKA